MFFSTIILYFLYNMLIPQPVLPKLDQNYLWSTAVEDTSIKPFKIEFNDRILIDLKERLENYKQNTLLLQNSGSAYGFNYKILNKIVDYWKEKYNFKKRMEYMNKYDQYKTNIQGLDIHYVHVKREVSENVKVLPILILHSWPNTCYQLFGAISKLLEKRDEYDFAFEIIAPSLPGYGFSQAPTKPGLGPVETAVILKNLMLRLGFEKFYLQGGDMFGSSMATLFPENVLGYHTTSPGFLFFYNPVLVAKALIGSYFPSFIVDEGMEEKMYPLSNYFPRVMGETGYLHLQATKPDTIGLVLSDSPAGLAAYVLEKYSYPEFKNDPEDFYLPNIDIDILLDSIMVYWLTNSVTTTMRSYAEAWSSKQMDMKIQLIPTTVPTRGMKLKDDPIYLPDGFLKYKYINYLRSTLQDGGNLPHLENPDVFVKDIFDAVEDFVKFHSKK